MSAGHTPTPWSFDGPASSIIVWGPDPDIRVCFMTSDGPAKENAALICRAVNAHDEMVEALRPFADLADEAEVSFTAADQAIGGPITDDDIVTVKIGDLRRARTTLSKALTTTPTGEVK